MTKFSGILFDIDGTVTSTNQLIFDSFNHISNKYNGKVLSEQEIIALFGPPEDVVIRTISPDNFEIVQKDYYDYYFNEHENKAKLFPGIKECIELVYNKKLPLGVFTGKGRRTTDISLTKLGVKDYFDPIITGDDVKNFKPSGDGIRIFMKKFNLPAEEVLMIGDSIHDILAARDAGVPVASVLWESYGKDEVIDMKPDYMFHTVEELYEFLKKSL